MTRPPELAPPSPWWTAGQPAPAVAARALTGAGLALLPWIAWLAFGPPQPPPGRWAWVAVDTAEAALLLTTARDLRNGHPRWRRTAVATGALLIADATLDLATARGGHRSRALAMAALVELPGAALLLAAARVERRATTADRRN